MFQQLQPNKRDPVLSERGNRQDAFSITFRAKAIATLGWKENSIDGGDSHSQNIQCEGNGEAEKQQDNHNVDFSCSDDHTDFDAYSECCRDENMMQHEFQPHLET